MNWAWKPSLLQHFNFALVQRFTVFVHVSRYVIGPKFSTVLGQIWPLFIGSLFILRHLDHDVGKHVGGLVSPVGSVAQVTVDLAQFEHLHHVFYVLWPVE